MTTLISPPTTRLRLSVRRADGATPYKAQIVLDRPSHTILLPWAPDEHEEQVRPRWVARGAAGVREDLLDWAGNDPRRVSFELTVSLPAGRPPEWLDAAVIQPLQFAAEAVVAEYAEPTRVTVLLGTHIYQGVLVRVGVRVLRTTPEGWSRTARLSVELIVNPKEQGDGTR